MNGMTKNYFSPKFLFLPIQPTYQLVTLKRSVIKTFCFHIAVFEPIPKENVRNFFL